MIHLEYPLLIIAIPLFLILWWIFFHEKIGYHFPNKLMQKHAEISIRILFLRIFRYASMCLIFLLVAQPQYQETRKYPIYSEKSITLVLDISKSMLADDIKPNRLEWAKKVLISLLEHENGNRFGLVVFAGKAFILSPLSHDKKGLINIIQNINTDTIKQHLPWLSGTNIGDALLAASTLEKERPKNNTIVLITDGRANIWADPILVGKYLYSQKSPIYTIGIGEASWTVLSYIDNAGKRQYFYDEKWEKIQADMDTAILEQIAQLTGGRFFQASDANMFTEIFDTLGKDLTTKLEYTDIKEEKSLKPLLYITLILSASWYLVLALWIRKI